MPADKKTIAKTSPLREWLSSHLSRITFVQKMFFVEHLRTMLHAGISITEALDILGKEAGGRRFRDMVKTLNQEVEKGRPLSEALSDIPDVFPPIYVKMVAAGEISGKLDESLAHIALQMRKTHELASSVRGAMIYPAVVFTAMSGVAVMTVTVVLPKLTEIFKEFKTDLPLATRILLRVVDAARSPLILAIILFSLLFSMAIFVYFLKKSSAFKRAAHSINLRLPIVGRVIREINLAQFSLTLSSLLKSAIPIIDAVEITADTCTNVRYRESLHDAAKTMKTGVPLSEILRAAGGLFPPIATEMLMVGERSGQIDTLLGEVAEYFAKEVDKTMKNFSTIIEPVIIIVLGAGVAGMAVAVIMPMYTLVQNF